MTSESLKAARKRMARELIEDLEKWGCVVRGLNIREVLEGRSRDLQFHAMEALAREVTERGNREWSGLTDFDRALFVILLDGEGE